MSAAKPKREPPEKKEFHTNTKHEEGDIVNGYRVVSCEETNETERFVYRLERVGRAG